MRLEILKSKDLQDEINTLGKKEKFLFEATQSKRKFISKLIELRKSKGLSQSELARMTGLSQQTVSNIETMNTNSLTLNLIIYLKGLGLDINDLIK